MMMEGKFSGEGSTASKKMTTCHMMVRELLEEAKVANQPMRFGRTLPTSVRRCLRSLQSKSWPMRNNQPKTTMYSMNRAAHLRSTPRRGSADTAESEPLPRGEAVLFHLLCRFGSGVAPAVQTNVLAFNALRQDLLTPQAVVDEEQCCCLPD